MLINQSTVSLKAALIDVLATWRQKNITTLMQWSQTILKLHYHSIIVTNMNEDLMSKECDVFKY